MNISKFLAGTALITASTFALATPEYTSSLYAEFPNALNEDSTDAQIDSELNGGEAGYYIWNSSAKDWHVRWTADTPNDDPRYFAGTFSIFNNSLNTTSEFQFENNGSDDLISVGLQNFGVVEWVAANTCCWDGFDVTLTEDFTFGDEIRFDLYSDIWDLSAFSGGEGSDGGLLGDSIYLGEGFDIPDVEILGLTEWTNPNTELTKNLMGQAFEITVPEPGTLALLGLGLAGLGAARRRQKA